MLTLSARRVAGESIRRIAPRRLIVLAAVVGAGIGAPIVLRPMISQPAARVAEQPVWAGSIAGSAVQPTIVPQRETSASYTSPVVIQAASAARAAKSCAPTGCANPQRDMRAVMPPRRPAMPPAAPVDTAQTPTPVVVAEPPPKPKSIFTPAGLMERLPKTDTLLKPFTLVGDKMSGVIKRF